MNTTQYKGYIINASPQQLTENKQWTVSIHIQKHRGGSVSDKPFSASNTFSSKKEAIEHCFRFGKQIIDGEIANCSIDDL